MKNPTHKAAHLRARQGFTLLELVVVVAVLVILAGFILPKFDVFKLKANKGVAAANMTSISRLIQQYYVQNSIYPDRWDSLLTDTGALWKPATSDTPPAPAPGIDPQLVGGPPAGSPTKLTVLELGPDPEIAEKSVRSLTRIGITTVFNRGEDADIEGKLPNDCFTVPSAITTATKFATINAADGDGKNIIEHIYPGSGGVVPAGKQLVVFGLGSQNTMLGQLMQEVPFYSNTDQTQYYSRYLVVFQLSEGGSRAELKLVIGADGDLVKEEIADYYER